MDRPDDNKTTIKPATGDNFGRRNKNFTQLSSVLPKIVRALGIDKRLKEHTFINLWPHIVPEPFASRSRPIFIDFERNLVVAVQDAVVGQEFGFARQKILALVRRAAFALGIEIRGLRFDMKRFYEGTLAETTVEEGFEKLPLPSEEDLASIELSDEEKARLEDLDLQVGNSEELERLSTRMRALYEKEMRLRRFREANGYPRCNYCQEVSTRLHGTDLICANCFASGMSMKGL